MSFPFRKTLIACCVTPVSFPRRFADSPESRIFCRRMSAICLFMIPIIITRITVDKANLAAYSNYCCGMAARVVVCFGMAGRGLLRSVRDWQVVVRAFPYPNHSVLWFGEARRVQVLCGMVV